MSSDSGQVPYRDLLASGPPETRPEAGPTQAGTTEAGTAEDGPVLVVVAPGELSARPYPGTTAPPAPKPEPVGPARLAGRPRSRPRLGGYLGFALLLFLGVGVAGAILVLVADDVSTYWDEEVPLGQETALTLPRAEERWIWVPEGHAEDVACTAGDGAGADLPMSRAPGEHHEDYETAFQFPTGNGSVTLSCRLTDDPQNPSWQPQSATLWLGRPSDLTYAPFLQNAILVLLGGPGVGVLVLVLAIVAQVAYGIVRLVRPSVARGPATAPAPEPVDLNTATAAELRRIHGIGRSLAAGIVAWRETHGPFGSVDDLVRVPGIGPSTVDAVRSQTTVSAGGFQHAE
ncbi:ComEA family DNA-binding protein [Georgenia alba]|uniref:ComEA family DNA-binding protein n=1 Tax=Georgenia alba TaxID=2233858 RepID=A0ABW2QBX7_9MICO